jgi:hypothetical protein
LYLISCTYPYFIKFYAISTQKSLTQIKVISDSIYNRDIQDFCVMFTRFEDTTEELFFMTKDDFDQQFEVQYDLHESNETGS